MACDGFTMLWARPYPRTYNGTSYSWWDLQKEKAQIWVGREVRIDLGWVEEERIQWNIFGWGKKISLYVLGLWLNGFDMFTGILNTVAMIGPIIGFIMSSVFARLYVDIGYVDLSK